MSCRSPLRLPLNWQASDIAEAQAHCGWEVFGQTKVHLSNAVCDCKRPHVKDFPRSLTKRSEDSRTLQFYRSMHLCPIPSLYQGFRRQILCWIAPSEMGHPEILNNYLRSGVARHDLRGPGSYRRSCVVCKGIFSGWNAETVFGVGGSGGQQWLELEHPWKLCPPKSRKQIGDGG